MKRKHLANPDEENLTMCGYEATPAEYARMKSSRYVNCKKCLERINV